jgi:PIN domain nuclease of toxin-antitoxin system
VVRKSLAGAVISAVNYSEVLKKTIERGGPVKIAVSRIDALSIAIIPFDDRQAAAAAELYPQAKPHGLSFADRACIALGLHERATVLTTDGKWKRLNIPLKLKLIRNEH